MIGALNDAFANSSVTGLSRADYYALSGIVAIEEAVNKNNAEAPCTTEGDCMPLVISNIKKLQCYRMIFLNTKLPVTKLLNDFK